MTVKAIPLQQCKPWALSELQISRPDGRFFSIEQRSNLFINQPEIGILAFIFFLESNSVHTLVQAKPEPGNIKQTQIAPTVQATLSNYSRVHGGAETVFLKELMAILDQPQQIINDTLQSEHGEKFYRKLNRNISAFTIDPPKPTQHYKSVPVSSLLEMLIDDFAVNTDARSVLVTSNWTNLLDFGLTPFARYKTEWGKRLMDSFEGPSKVKAAMEFIHSCRQDEQFDENPTKALGVLENVDLIHSIKDIFDDSYSVQFFNVTSNTREVSEWNQPLLLSKEPDAQILLARPSADGIEFLLKARREPGLLNSVEFGPSFTRSDLSSSAKNKDQVDLLNEAKQIIRYSKPKLRVQQSDEGGRFYESIGDYQIYFYTENKLLQYSDEYFLDLNYLWVNLRTLQDICLLEGSTTNELRSTISLILYWL
jgi:oxidase EvaA